MNEPFETVIAGSKAFALALFAPLTERVGTRPRIAADPAQAVALVPGAGLVILELQDPSWIASVQQLAAERPDLRFVAALSKGTEGAAAPLRSMGVEAISWTNVTALLPLVDRALAGGDAAPGAEPSPPPPAAKVAPPPIAVGAAPPPPAPAPAAPAAPEALFDGLDDDDFDVDVAEEASAGDPFAGYAPSGGGAAAWNPAATWPGNAPGMELSEQVLLAALEGAEPPVPELAEVAAQVAAVLSEIERAALLGASPGFDATPIRMSAAMRVRVGFAFASAPPPGSNSDSAAVAAFLGEIDALLAEVNALAADAPEELAPALGGCRNALVKEAIDFSEVAQRYVPVEVEAAAATAPSPKVAGARVLSVREEGEHPIDRRQRALLVACGVAAAAAAAFHGYNFWARTQAGALAPPVEVAGPPGFTGVAAPGGGPTVLQPTGAGASAAEIESFKEMEKLKGNQVIELPGGAVVVQPRPQR